MIKILWRCITILECFTQYVHFLFYVSNICTYTYTPNKATFNQVTVRKRSFRNHHASIAKISKWSGTKMHKESRYACSWIVIYIDRESNCEILGDSRHKPCTNDYGKIVKQKQRQLHETYWDTYLGIADWLVAHLNNHACALHLVTSEMFETHSGRAETHLLLPGWVIVQVCFIKRPLVMCVVIHPLTEMIPKVKPPAPNRHGHSRGQWLQRILLLY